MSIALQPHEACQYSLNCPYNQGQNTCIGADSSRGRTFVCDLVSENGVFSESGFRSKHDETGKMKIILEDQK
jgi:hypothetical protein